MNLNMDAPQSFSDIWKHIFDLIKRTASRNFTLGLITIAPGVLFVAFALLIAPDTGTADITDAEVSVLFWSFFLLMVGYVLVLILDIWCTLAAIKIVERESENEQLTVGQALRDMKDKFFPSLGFMALEGVVLSVYLVVGAIVFLLLGMPILTFAGEGGEVGAMAGVIATIGIIVLIIPAVYLMVAWAFGLQAIAIDGAGPVEAFSRSRGLVEGAWWKIFFIIVIATAAYQIPSWAITELLSFTGVFGSAVDNASDSMKPFDPAMLVQFVRPAVERGVSLVSSYLLASLIVPVYTTVLYLIRRSVKETELLQAVENTDLDELNTEIV